MPPPLVENGQLFTPYDATDSDEASTDMVDILCDAGYGYKVR